MNLSIIVRYFYLFTNDAVFIFLFYIYILSLIASGISIIMSDEEDYTIVSKPRPPSTKQPVKRFKLEDFGLLKVLGKGSFGKVCVTVLWDDFYNLCLVLRYSLQNIIIIIIIIMSDEFQIFKSLVFSSATYMLHSM